MRENSGSAVVLPSVSSRDVRSEILREGAQRMLAEGVQAEVAEWTEERPDVVDERGRQQVVRNGSMPKRSILTGLGELEVEQPRVHDRRSGDQRERVTSKILLPYLRKSKSIDELIPWLYLKGVSTGDFPEAMAALVGADAKGLSTNTVTRLKQEWECEQEARSKRSLTNKVYVYFWVERVHFNIRSEEDRQCILVLMGATNDRDQRRIS